MDLLSPRLASPPPAPELVIVVGGIAQICHNIPVVWEKWMPKPKQVFVRSEEREMGDAQLSKNLNQVM